MFLLILACVCLVWCTHFYWKRRRLYALSWNIPGPRGLPLIGSAHLFFWGDAATVVQRFLKIFDDYPGICKGWMGHRLFYLISKPEYLEIVLNSPSAFEKMEMYDFVKPLIGNGMISGPARIWRRHRKIIAPSMNRKILYDYVDKINEQSQVLVEMLGEVCGKGEINLGRYVTNCTIDIIGETIFGVPIDTQTSGINYNHLLDRLFETMYQRIFKLWCHFDLIFHRTKEYQDQKKIIEIFKNITNTCIEKKIEQLKHQLYLDKKNLSFLDLVVEKFRSKEFSREELEDEVMTFFAAGTDTNATAISFALLLLGMHQDVQQRLYEETVDVLGPDRTITVDDLSKLQYTDRVVRETLRLFPGVPAVSRIVEEDIDLGDVTIPKGANVIAGFLHLHMNEKYWPEPFKFDPDRFLPERSLNRHPYTWLPFSGGPRNCIGMQFGMIVTKIVTAMVVRKFKVTSSFGSIQDIPLTVNIVIKPRNGFNLAFELR